MIPLSAAVSTRYTWRSLPKNQGCELVFEDDVVGTLRHPAPGSCDFQASTPRGNWIFRRSGFLGTSTEILDTASQRIAVFRSAWGGRGTLTFEDDQTFHLVCKGLLRPAWIITSDDGTPLLFLHTREQFVELSESSVHVGNARDPRLSLLIMFTLYRIRQAEEDVASAAVVA